MRRLPRAHDIIAAGLAGVPARPSTRCARSCHAESLKTYLDSYHGKAFFLGDVKTAVCTDCHGGHKILAPSDPASTVNQANLIATCAQCHPGANRTSSVSWSTSTRSSPHSSLLVWIFYAAYIMLIAVVFTFGAIHSGLYIYRGFKDGLYRTPLPRNATSARSRCARASSTSGSTSFTAGCTSSSS